MAFCSDTSELQLHVLLQHNSIEKQTTCLALFESEHSMTICFPFQTPFDCKFKFILGKLFVRNFVYNTFTKIQEAFCHVTTCPIQVTRCVNGCAEDYGPMTLQVNCSSFQ